MDPLCAPAPWTQLMQKQLQAFMKSHFHSFPALLKTPLISRLMMDTTVHRPQDWPTPRPVGKNGMGELWAFGAGLEVLPSWLPTPLGLSFPSHPRHDAWGCTHSLKESLALHRAFIETKMDSGRWGHSMTLSFSSVSACVPHYTCLPPPVSMPPSFSPPSSPSGKYQRPRPLCCLRGWKPRHHQTSPNPGLTFLNVNQTL